MSQGVSLNTAAVTDAWLTHAVWPRRIIAFLIDIIAITILVTALAWVIFVFGVLTFGIGFIALHLIPFVPALYYILWLLTRGSATPGQRMLGLSVRTDAMLARPNFAQALVWTILLGISLGLSFLPFLLVLITKRHRAAHDLLTGLVVINDVALLPERTL